MSYELLAIGYELSAHWLSPLLVEDTACGAPWNSRNDSV